MWALAVELTAATAALAFVIMRAGDYLNTSRVRRDIVITVLGLIPGWCPRGLLLMAGPSWRG